MTRFGVMKHLRVLEDAGLVVTPPVGPGEAALPEPRADPADPRPVDRQVRGAPRLGARRPQDRAGGDCMTTMTHRRRRCTRSSSARPPSRSGTRSRARVHAALLLRERVDSDFDAGRSYAGWAADRTQQFVDGEVLEADPPQQACHDLAGAVRPRAGGRAVQPGHLGDRGGRRGVTKLTVVHDELDAAPKTAAERRRRLELRPERAQVRARDRGRPELNVPVPGTYRCLAPLFAWQPAPRGLALA